LRALILFVGWVMPVASFAAALSAPDFVSGSPRTTSAAAAIPASAPEFCTTGFDVGLAGQMQSARADGLTACGRRAHASTILIATAAMAAAPWGPERAVRHPEIRQYPTG
jgi:hypothetical protein